MSCRKQGECAADVTRDHQPLTDRRRHHPAREARLLERRPRPRTLMQQRGIRKTLMLLFRMLGEWWG